MTESVIRNTCGKALPREEIELVLVLAQPIFRAYRQFLDRTSIQQFEEMRVRRSSDRFAPAPERADFHKYTEVRQWVNPKNT
jgi:hypothetical protein